MSTGDFPILHNIILQTDSYKLSHYRQYPPGTTKVYSYFESRGGKFPKVVFFGLNYIIKRWLTGQVVTPEKLKEAEQIIAMHMADETLFNIKGWKHILEKHNGYLPIKITAVPEGSVVPLHNVLFTVENTDPECFWLTSYLETLLVQTWYPSTVCTNSWAQKGIIASYLAETADDMSSLDFKLHDFGFRGASSVESAGIGGCAHLVNFRGTDTVAALLVARKYYGCQMAGYSIPAAEHSSITSWGQKNECDAYENMLKQFPNGKVSVVSDSYDIFKACDNLWGKKLRDQVIERGKRGAVLVIRPDSGDPATTVIRCLNILGERFGITLNSKGYKMLPPYLRIIQGDGISFDSLSGIIEEIKKAGWSTENVVFGSGGALLQKLHRDTLQMAFKCSMIEANGKEIDVFKDPITDPGKTSKKGHLSLELRDGEYVTVQEGKGDPAKNLLVTVFENGKLLRDWTLDEIRQRADAYRFELKPSHP